MHVCVYIYIYTHTHMYLSLSIYIYIYIHTYVYIITLYHIIVAGPLFLDALVCTSVAGLATSADGGQTWFSAANSHTYTPII